MFFGLTIGGMIGCVLCMIFRDSEIVQAAPWIPLAIVLIVVNTVYTI
jgi:hypothetical protein